MSEPILAVIVIHESGARTCKGVYAGSVEAAEAMKEALSLKQRAELVIAKDFINDLIDRQDRQGKYELASID